MTAAQLDRVKRILADVSRLPPNERSQFVAKECGHDTAVRREVQSLLDLETRAGEFLNFPLPELMGAKDRSLVAPLAPGSLVKGRYRIQELLAKGGFAAVYLAVDEAVAQKPVVLKLLEREYQSESFREVFEAELQSLSRLQHPNVAGLTDAGELADGSPFLVMSFIPGKTLRQALQEGPISPSRQRLILEGLGQALAATHRAGVWHLDVKPENVIVSDANTPAERVTLVDFGIARLKMLPGNAVRMAATTRYAAPEQLDNPSAQCDLYALALVAFELTTGHLPDLSRPIEHQMHGPRPMRLAVTQALNRDPGQRQATAEEFVEQALAEPRMAWPAKLAAIGAVGLLTAAGAVSMWWNAPKPTKLFAPAPLVTAPGLQYRPAFSADGEWIYFASPVANHFDIFRQRLTGGDPVRIVVHTADDDDPMPSPDGANLAFIRRAPNSVTAILTKSDGSGPEMELFRERDVDSFGWHPAGRHLVVSAGFPDEGINRLRLFEIATRRWTELASAPAGMQDDHYPAAAPDGRSIAFVRKWKDGSADLFVMDVDARLQPVGNPRRITNKLERIESVQWTPDSRELIYAAGPLGQASVMRVSAAGGDPQPLLGLEKQVERIAVPLRAWKLAYSVHRSDINIWRQDLVAQTTPGAEQLLLASSYDDEEPRISPDGTMIAFSSSRSGTEQIWVADSDGNEARQVTFHPDANSMAVNWSRDSKELVISIRQASQGERVFLAPAKGGEGLVQILADAMATDISRDGRWLYFVRKTDGVKRLWRTEYPSPKTFVRMTPGPAAYAREAVDAKSVYFAQQHEDAGLWQQPLRGGPPKRVADRLYRRNLFVPSKDGVYYMARSGDAFGLFFLSQTTGQTKRVAAFSQDIFWGLDLSPDQRSVYYSRYDVANADIMLIDDFR